MITQTDGSYQRKVTKGSNLGFSFTPEQEVLNVLVLNHIICNIV